MTVYCTIRSTSTTKTQVRNYNEILQKVNTIPSYFIFIGIPRLYNPPVCLKIPISF